MRQCLLKFSSRGQIIVRIESNNLCVHWLIIFGGSVRDSCNKANRLPSLFLFVIFSRPLNSSVIILVEAFLCNISLETSLWNSWSKRKWQIRAQILHGIVRMILFLCVVLRNCNFLKYFVLQVIRDCCRQIPTCLCYAFSVRMKFLLKTWYHVDLWLYDELY